MPIQIIQLTLLTNEKILRLNFRSEEEAANCLQLNQIYFVIDGAIQGKKVLFISSRFLAVNKGKPLNLDKLKIVKNEVQDKFRQLYVANLPYMNTM